MINEIATKQTLYEQTANLIVERIASGQYRVGRMLPSETALSKTLGVSQGTVRKGLDELARQGLLERRQGVGTFVSGMNADWGEHPLIDLGVSRCRSAHPAQWILSVAPSHADEFVADRLGLEPGARIWAALSIWRVGGVKVALDRIRVPREGLEFIGDVPGPDSPLGVLNLLQTRLRLRLRTLELGFRLDSADALDAEHLDLTDGSKVLRMSRVSGTNPGAGVAEGAGKLEFRSRTLCDPAFELCVFAPGCREAPAK